MEAPKNKCPIHNTFFLLCKGHKIFETLISSASQIVVKKNYFQNIEVNTPFQYQVQVFV